jgi:hypothetical protein
MVLRKLRSLVFVFTVLALLAGSYLVGRSFADRRVSHAQVAVSPVSPASLEGAFACDVNNVAAFENRIHVRCSSSPGSGIYYFAYPTNAGGGYTANRMLAVAQTAFALGKPLWVYYYESSEYNPPDCLTQDCRLLTGVSILE